MKPKLITQNMLAGLLPARPRNSHKGMFGTVLIAGGASGMTGAALIAGRAALKMGAGLVHVALLADEAPAVDLVQPELMLHRACLPLPRATVIVAGCGMGQSDQAKALLHAVLSTDAARVLDADALNLLSLHPELIAHLGAAVLTPHPKEAARLLCCSVEEIQRDRVAAVARLADKYACPVVLKGAGSLCATPQKRFINATGNPGISAPGMGDVLAGMIAAFIAQGLTASDALLLAVHLHGAAGDALGCRLGMTATELTDSARKLLNLWMPQDI